jgi:nucleoid-associated protein YgaU
MGLFGTKEKPKPDFSSVKSGSSSTAPAPVPQADGNIAPINVSRTYVVVKGDRDLIKDPDLIFPGQELRIPQ